MGNERASIFDEADGLDLSGFAPQTSPADDAAPVARVRAVAEASKFPSREPRAKTQAEELATSKREPRRHRTGRNMQLNVKVSQETVDAFYRLSDMNAWVLGETLARALTALERELAAE